MAAVKRMRLQEKTPFNGTHSQSITTAREFSARATVLQNSRPHQRDETWKIRPRNTVLMFVPQQEAWIVERMGKFNSILEPGLNILVPFIDKVKYVQLLKEIAIEIPHQSAITKDNVVLALDGVLYLRIRDPYKASYGVENAEFAITQLAQTTMRSEIGKIFLDTLNQDREMLNHEIVASINTAAGAWGIECLRYEIRNIELPEKIKDSLQLQSEAERKKRAKVLESEGIKQSDINMAEGKRQAQILKSEAEKQELINKAHGEAEQVIAAAKARAESIDLISKKLGEANGQNAASFAVAEKYITAFGELAKMNNTLILPSDTGNVSNMVAQAMAIYSNIQTKNEISNEDMISETSVKDS